ncbi:MAG: hypothetical protein F6K11_04350 [Leptolyngbya sp. SIO3F4]|nr:hypothetical protein [Leptolyngbya sp. SIO3F4]
MNYKLPAAAIACLTLLSTALISYGKTSTGPMIDVSPKLDDYKSLEIGMTEIEVEAIDGHFISFPIWKSPTTIPNGTSVYKARINQPIGQKTFGDKVKEMNPASYEVLLAFKTNSSQERILVSKRIGSDTIAADHTVGDVECFPVDSLLCEGRWAQWLH